MELAAARRVNADGDRVPDGVTGELGVSGPTLLSGHPGVRDTAVVRKRDAQWFDEPPAFVSSPEAALPRSSTGKVQRHEIERQWQLT